MGSSSRRESEDSSGSSGHDHMNRRVRNSSSSKSRKYDVTRYFIIKSLSHENIRLSVEKGIWATQVMNEPILDEAFHNSSRVILIFSVNMSGFFQGYAQMMSSVGWKRDNVWSGSSSGSSPWGRTFKVKWLRLYDLPFQKTLHLKNPLNDYKAVKISRDCQELSPGVGEALCELIDMDGKLKRNDVIREEFLQKRPSTEYPYPSQDEDSHSVNRMWAQQHVFYHSPVYQHAMLAGAHNIHTLQGTFTGGAINEHNQVEEPRSSRTEHARNTPAEQSKEKTPSANALSEDDFLDMTYEEYLDTYGRNSDSSAHR